MSNIQYSYPHQFAAFVHELWNCPSVLQTLRESIDFIRPEPLPRVADLEDFLSVAYQASLLRDEGRGSSFRLILMNPESLPAEEGPPTGLHRLELTEPRPFNAQELRRLSPAVDYDRSLIAVRHVQRQAGANFEIWGLVHSGPRWLFRQRGGRLLSVSMPPVLIACVTGPGSIEVMQGPLTVAKLAEGILIGQPLDVFDSQWLPKSFADMREEIFKQHLASRERAGGRWAHLDPAILSKISQQMVRRLIATIQMEHHGGTLLVVPPEYTQELSAPNRFIQFKYQFAAAEPRARFNTLIVKTINTLAELNGSAQESSKAVGWSDYVNSYDEKLITLNEAIFEMSYLIAELAAVDGAVVMNKRFELIGFGGEITGELPQVNEVARALDLEGVQIEVEAVTNVGTRHRSAYRLCHSMRDALATVISQDGSVRFIKWLNGHVIYWNQMGA